MCKNVKCSQVFLNYFTLYVIPAYHALPTIIYKFVLFFFFFVLCSVLICYIYYIVFSYSYIFIIYIYVFFLLT